MWGERGARTASHCPIIQGQLSCGIKFTLPALSGMKLSKDVTQQDLYFTHTYTLLSPVSCSFFESSSSWMVSHLPDNPRQGKKS